MSLKSIEEVLYGFKRTADVKKAEDSVKLYDFWLSSKDKKTKEDIIEYNKDDCESTFHPKRIFSPNKPESIDWFSINENRKEIYRKKGLGEN